MNRDRKLKISTAPTRAKLREPATCWNEAADLNRPPVWSGNWWIPF